MSEIKSHMQLQFHTLPTGPIQVGYDPTVYTTSEVEGRVELTIFVFSHPVDGAPRPFTLSVSTQDESAGIYSNRDYVRTVLIMCQ